VSSLIEIGQPSRETSCPAELLLTNRQWTDGQRYCWKCEQKAKK